MTTYHCRVCLLCVTLTTSLFLYLSHFSRAEAASLPVTTTGDSGPGSLRQAMIDANISPGPDTINVAVSGTIVIDSPLPQVQDDVMLQGPGSDLLTVSGSYLYRILDVRAGAVMTVTDLALTQGRAPNGEAGGAIRSYGALTLQRVHLHNNLSVSTGAAVYVENGRLYIVDSRIQNNKANTNGGVSIKRSTATITGTVFAGNGGIALDVYRSPGLYITATQVISNTGRGLEVESSNTYLSDLQIAANTGGGIKVRGGLLTMADSSVEDNRSDEGAGLYATWGAILITDTVLARNAAQGDGGAIYQLLSDARFTMTGGSIVSNTASSGAGIYVGGGSLQVRGTHILGNRGEQGAALYLSSMRDAVVADSCIAGNWASDGLAVQMAGWNDYFLSAPNNWWGAADGPSGAGIGSGDSVDERVIYVNFKTAAPESCPTLQWLYLPAMNR